MLYRKKYLFNKTIKFKKFFSRTLKTKIIKSFINNYKQHYIKRVSFLLQRRKTNRHKDFYNSQNSLICCFLSVKKVPSKKIAFSRFYYVRNANSLLLAGYQK